MQEEEIKSRIIKFLEELPEREFDGKRVKDIRYDGWPIWWFFKQRFLGNHLISPLASHGEIIESILDNKKPGFRQNLKNKIAVFTLRNFMGYNEKTKLWISRLNKKRIIEKTDKKKIMFMAHSNSILLDAGHGYTVDRVKTAIKEVRDDPELEEYISIIDPLSHRSSLKLLEYENLVYGYVDKEIKEKAGKESSLLHKEWKDISKNLKGNIAEQFRPALDTFFSREVIYLIILYYEAYKKIIKQEKIRLTCFYAGGGVLSKCAIAASHKSGIKSLVVSHGLGISKLNPDQPDSVYYAIIGSKYRDNLIRIGVNPENIYVTGPAFMDEIVGYVGKGKKIKGRRRILIITTPMIEANLIKREEYVEYVEKLLSDLNKLENVEMTIKLHPREKSKIYDEIVKGLGYDNIKMVQGQEKSKLYSLINESDIVLGFVSTVSVEAMIIGKPSLIVNLLPAIPKDYIMSDERAVCMGREEAASKIVGEILDDRRKEKELLEKQEELIRDYLYKIDGKAGVRTLELIKEII